MTDDRSTVPYAASIRNTRTGKRTYGYVTALNDDGTVDFTYDAGGRLGEQTRTLNPTRLIGRAAR